MLGRPFLLHRLGLKYDINHNGGTNHDGGTVLSHILADRTYSVRGLALIRGSAVRHDRYMIAALL